MEHGAGSTVNPEGRLVTDNTNGTAPGQDARAHAGQYLTFHLASEVYGLEILKIQEIIGMMDVTVVPRTPEHVRGVINLRGKVIPVLDLRIVFGMPPQDDTNRTCIIVVQVRDRNADKTVGFIVDEVSEVLQVTGDQMEERPSLGASAENDFILGMGKVGGKVIMLLDADKLLGDTDFQELAVAGEEAT